MQKSKSTDGGCCTTIKSHEIIRKYQTWNSWIHWKCQIQNIRNSKPLIMTLAGMPENRPRRSKYGPSAWKKCEKLKIDPAWPSQILEKNRVRNNHFRRLFVFKVYSLPVRGLIGWKLAREMTPLLNWAISSFDDSTASKLVRIYICVFSSFLFWIQSFMLMRVCWRQTFMVESTILWRKFSQPNHHQSHQSSRHHH